MGTTRLAREKEHLCHNVSCVGPRQRRDGLEQSIRFPTRLAWKRNHLCPNVSCVGPHPRRDGLEQSRRLELDIGHAWYSLV